MLYTHNDSGDRARFFAVGPDGVTRTVYTLPGVQARDWEDLARSPDERGRSCLWLGDIGDNRASRSNGILIHRVREPEPAARAAVTTERPTDSRLRYPDGPHDAETLLVHPRTGRVYVVTKPLAGAVGVYAAPVQLDPSRPNALSLVARFSPRSTGTPGGPDLGPLANVLVTGGDIAPDGSRVAVRTYTDVYEWAVPGDDVAAAFNGAPEVSPLPPTRQGEGLGYSRDGTALLTSSEGVGAPVYGLRRSTPPPSVAASSSAARTTRADVPQPADAGTSVSARAAALLAAAGVACGLLIMLAGRRNRVRS